jgi:hypothetical protein
MKQQDQNNNRVRIINKTKEGCILDFKGSVGQKYITWEEFKKIYTIKDHMNKDKKVSHKKANSNNLKNTASTFSKINDNQIKKE